MGLHGLGTSHPFLQHCQALQKCHAMKANVIYPSKQLTCSAPSLSAPCLAEIYKYSKSAINRGSLLRLCQLWLELTVQLLITPQQQLDRVETEGGVQPSQQKNFEADVTASERRLSSEKPT